MRWNDVVIRSYALYNWFKCRRIVGKLKSNLILIPSNPGTAVISCPTLNPTFKMYGPRTSTKKWRNLPDLFNAILSSPWYRTLHSGYLVSRNHCQQMWSRSAILFRARMLILFSQKKRGINKDDPNRAFNCRLEWKNTPTHLHLAIQLQIWQGQRSYSGSVVWLTDKSWCEIR